MAKTIDRRRFVGSALALGAIPLPDSSLHHLFGLSRRVVDASNELYFGGGDGETGTNNELIPTTDGGYAFTGKIADNALWLVKVDADGAKEWDRWFWTDVKYEVSGRDVVETTDGGFFIAGSGRVPDSTGPVETDTFAVKTGPDGEKRWRTRMGSSVVPEGAVETVRSAVELEDGGYVVAGSITEDRSSDPVFTKLTPEGEVAWKRVREMPNYVDNLLFEPGAQTGVALLEPAEGGFRAALLVGPRRDVADLQFVRFDADGTKRASRVVDPARDGESIPVALARHPDGGYVVIATVRKQRRVFQRLVSLTESFEVRWRRRLSEVGRATGVSVGDDGEILVTGNADDGTWVARYSSTGSYRWVRTGYHGTLNGEFGGLVVRDGSSVVAGTAETDGAVGYRNAWLLELVETDDERIEGVLGLAGLGLVWTVVASALGGDGGGD